MKDMKKQLQELPGEIKTLHLKIFHTQKTLEDTERTIKEWETKEMEDICEQKDVFTNADKRKAELERRKKETLSDVIEDVKKLKNDIEMQKIDLAFLRDTQSNLRAIARLGDT